MHKNAMKCNKTQSKWYINKHGASKIIDTFETYQYNIVDRPLTWLQDYVNAVQFAGDHPILLYAICP
jgi:hypothetical protein